ncbi:MAG: hypothetical protein IPI17_05600 [Nitrosomonas sp.]|nr:hypothetical protein [Nitrosomonas sp.]
MMTSFLLVKGLRIAMMYQGVNVEGLEAYEATSIARLDQAEKLMNAVMQKAIIPAIPLYLLTLLQSIDAGRSGDFKESALGYYYQYLLTEAFQNSGVKSDKLTELFQYSVYLAWEFHHQGKRELSELDLRAFNERFSNEWHTESPRYFRRQVFLSQAASAGSSCWR